MFTGKKSDKSIAMQLDMSVPSIRDIDDPPNSILVCSDGSVILGSDRENIDIVYWYPCFEMIPFFEGSNFNIDNYLEDTPTIEYFSTNFLVVGPIKIGEGYN